MSVSKAEFDELLACLHDGSASAEQIAELEPYRVENAIIMAAGIGSRLAPLSYEKPKGMLEVRGEVLIERLIRQLHEAGVGDITVVVGYMKGAFFYLEEAFGVRIAVNPDYAERNNHSSLMAVRDRLKNTYVCASDQYLSRNVFEPYLYEPACAVVRGAGETYGLTVEVGEDGLIAGRARDTTEAPCMRCPIYLDRTSSERFIAILSREYDDPATAGKRWSDICLDHIDEFHIGARFLEPGVLQEFDYLDDLCCFDHGFIDNVDSSILDNICMVLGCVRGDIAGITPISKGLTNLSFLFSCGARQYVYRYPGAGTDKIVNRRSEAWSQQIASELGLDSTFVSEDPERGWKISRYIADCEPFDYGDLIQVSEALRLIHRLHRCGRVSPWSFDFHDETVKIIALLRDCAYPLPSDLGAMEDQADRLTMCVREDAVEPCLCHNDFYGPNLLVKGSGLSLIDWEYSAMGDYGADIGSFIAQGSGYTIEQATAILDLYFDRPAMPSEVRHCMAQTAIVGFYWYVWALYKESQGNPVGEWLYIWYRAAKMFGNHALGLYGR